MKNSSSKQEGIYAIIAALIVLFSAIWNPMVSVVVSIAALGLYGIYKFLQN